MTNRKDTTLADARTSTLELDNPAKQAQNAISGEVPMAGMDWKPPAVLETPPAPAGYKYTWIRTAFDKNGSRPDTANISAMQRQGWRPVLKTEVPEGYFTPTIFDARFNNGAETIGVGDAVLMKIPTRMKKQRDAYYAQIAQNQVRGIDEALRKEAQRPGDRFEINRHTTTSLRKAPDDTDE